MNAAMVRINSEERKVDGRIGALYSFCCSLQDNQLVYLVSLVCLVYSVYFVCLLKPD